MSCIGIEMAESIAKKSMTGGSSGTVALKHEIP